MAVVSTRKKYFFGENFTQRINVRSDGTFYCKIPPKAAEILGCSDKISAETLVDLEREFDRCIDAAVNHDVQESKVILYCIALKGSIDGRPKFDEISFCSGLGLSLIAGVFKRLQYKVTKVGLSTKYELLKSSIPESAMTYGSSELGSGYTIPEHDDDIFCLEWTKEREKFFANAVSGLEDLILKLSECRQPDAILKLSSKKGKLLSG